MVIACDCCLASKKITSDVAYLLYKNQIYELKLKVAYKGHFLTSHVA